MKNDQKLGMPNSFFRIIMEAAAKGKPASSIYTQVLGKSEDGFMEYPKFELWYDRFVQKKEVALKMKKKKKGSQQRSRLQFSDLTTDVISKVLDNLDVPSRLATRNTSKSLRGIIDSRNPNIKSIKFYALRSLMTVAFVDSHQKTSRFRFQDRNTPSSAHLYRAQSFLAPILKNPKLELANLELETSLAVERFSKILRAQKRKIHVETLKITSDASGTLLSIAQHLKTGVLKNLEWNARRIDNIQNFVKLFGSDHWKNLEFFKFVEGAEFPIETGIQNLFHLKGFDVFVNEITVELLEEIKDNLLSSAHFQTATFRVPERNFDDDADDGIPEIFGNLLKNFKVTYRNDGEAGRHFGCLKIRRI